MAFARQKSDLAIPRGSAYWGECHLPSSGQAPPPFMSRWRSLRDRA